MCTELPVEIQTRFSVEVCVIRQTYNLHLPIKQESRDYLKKKKKSHIQQSSEQSIARNIFFSPYPAIIQDNTDAVARSKACLAVQLRNWSFPSERRLGVTDSCFGKFRVFTADASKLVSDERSK